MIAYHIKYILLILVGIAPIIIFIDVVMDIQLTLDYGFWTAIGFIVCVNFYAVMASYAWKLKR